MPLGGGASLRSGTSRRSRARWGSARQRGRRGKWPRADSGVDDVPDGESVGDVEMKPPASPSSSRRKGTKKTRSLKLEVRDEGGDGLVEDE